MTRGVGKVDPKLVLASSKRPKFDDSAVNILKLEKSLEDSQARSNNFKRIKKKINVYKGSSLSNAGSEIIGFFTLKNRKKNSVSPLI